ncbi:MAG TPA: hypothetical protein VKQ30_09395 [Ktedonobacterales bacterium]|nr:hypothetical protein [Ktedonobacterales bacterium]
MDDPPLFDGHHDVLLSLYLPDRSAGRSFFARRKITHVNWPRVLRATWRA